MLIENAIKHGISPDAAPGWLKVKAEKQAALCGCYRSAIGTKLPAPLKALAVHWLTYTMIAVATGDSIRCQQIKTEHQFEVRISCLMFNTLLVDDERLARAELRRLLSPYPQISIQAEASTAEQALELMQQQAFDLVFLDIQMPGLSGFGSWHHNYSHTAILYFVLLLTSMLWMLLNLMRWIIY